MLCYKYKLLLPFSFQICCFYNQESKVLFWLFVIYFSLVIFPSGNCFANISLSFEWNTWQVPTVHVALYTVTCISMSSPAISKDFQFWSADVLVRFRSILFLSFFLYFVFDHLSLCLCHCHCRNSQHRTLSFLCQLYPKLMQCFTEDDHDYSVCAVSESVQIFTVPTLVGAAATWFYWALPTLWVSSTRFCFVALPAANAGVYSGRPFSLSLHYVLFRANIHCANFGRCSFF